MMSGRQKPGSQKICRSEKSLLNSDALENVIVTSEQRGPSKARKNERVLNKASLEKDVCFGLDFIITRFMENKYNRY